MADYLNHDIEFVFLYDVFFSNPNGDPLAENQLREDGNRIFTTDIRFNRTCRDYIIEYKGYGIDSVDDLKGKKEIQDVYVRMVNDKNIKNSERRKILIDAYEKTTGKKVEKSKDMIEMLLSTCIDIRWFGGLFTAKDASFGFVGPIKMNYGISLHDVDKKSIQVTSVFASKEEKERGSLGMQYITPYALIGTYGTIKSSLAQKTHLTERDVELFFESLWYGTMNLRTSSKKQLPRLLLRVDYNQDKKGVFIGYDLLWKMKFNAKTVEEKMVRSPEDYELDLSLATMIIDKQSSFIDKVLIKKHIGIEESLIGVNSKWKSYELPIERQKDATVL